MMEIIVFYNFYHFRWAEEFNRAQCEAGTIALRHEATVVTHKDFMDGILEVQTKKKQNLHYYA